MKKIYPNRRTVVRIQAKIAELIRNKPCVAPKWCMVCDECAQKVGKMIDRRLDAAKCNPLHFYRVEQILISNRCHCQWIRDTVAASRRWLQVVEGA